MADWKQARGEEQQKCIEKLRSAIRTYETKYKQLVLVELAIVRALKELSEVVAWRGFSDLMTDEQGDQNIWGYESLAAYEQHKETLADYRPVFSMPTVEDLEDYEDNI